MNISMKSGRRSPFARRWGWWFSGVGFLGFRLLCLYFEGCRMIFDCVLLLFRYESFFDSLRVFGEWWYKKGGSRIVKWWKNFLENDLKKFQIIKWNICLLIKLYYTFFNIDFVSGRYFLKNGRIRFFLEKISGCLSLCFFFSFYFPVFMYKI